MARITRRASSSCAKGDAYATVSLACVWSADRGRVGPGAAGLRRRADAVRSRGTAATSPNTQTPPPAQTKPPPPDQAAQPAAPDPAAEDSRSLFAPRWNMFQLAGRLSSVSGDPARWQRYQDLRDGLLFTEGRVLHETPDWNGTLARRQRRLARPALFRQLRANRPVQDQRPVGRDPAVLQRRHAHGFHRGRRWCAPAGRQRTTGGKPQRVPVDLTAIRPARAPRHRHVSRQRHTDRERRRHWRLYDDQALGRVAVGGELRVQQRQRSGAALQVPDERHGRRSASGRTRGRCFAPPTTVRGSTTRPTR